MYSNTSDVETELNLSSLSLHTCAVFDSFPSRKQQRTATGNRVTFRGAPVCFTSDRFVILWVLSDVNQSGRDLSPFRGRSNLTVFILKASTVSEGSWRPNQFSGFFLSALLWVGGPPQVEGDTHRDCLFIAAADVQRQSGGCQGFAQWLKSSG